jgi:uncharacterized protein
MFKNSLFSAVLFAFIALAGACGPRSDDTTPEMAERLLKLRGYFFTQQDFFKAIRLGDGRAVKAFLQGGMDPNVRDPDGRSALNFALENTDASMIEPLMQKADLVSIDGAGNTPVFMALKYGHQEIFDRLLATGADINSTGQSGVVGKQTLLQLAVQKRDARMVRALLEKGADPNRADDRGTVPLFETVTGETPNLELIDLLIDKGADINRANPETGSTALLYTAANFRMRSDSKLQAIRALLEKGADPNKQDISNGYTALMYVAIDYQMPPETREQMLKALLDGGANKTLKNAEGKTVQDLIKETAKQENDSGPNN